MNRIFVGVLLVGLILVRSSLAQGCKKSCATASSGCGKERSNVTSFISSGEVLACIHDCESDFAEYGVARLIGHVDNKQYEVEWVTHSNPDEIGKKSMVKTVIRKLRSPAWKELTQGNVVLISSGPLFKKGKIISLNEQTQKVKIEYKNKNKTHITEADLSSIGIIN